MNATHPNHRDQHAGPAAIDTKVFDQYRDIDPCGGLGLAYRIVQVYLDNSGATVQQAAQAVACRDTEALRLAAHSLKSSTASVGAGALAELFRELETLARAARMDDAVVLFDTARSEYERVLAALRDLLAEAP